MSQRCEIVTQLRNKWKLKCVAKFAAIKRNGDRQANSFEDTFCIIFLRNYLSSFHKRGHVANTEQIGRAFVKKKDKGVESGNARANR